MRSCAEARGPDLVAQLHEARLAIEPAVTVMAARKVAAAGASSRTDCSSRSNAADHVARLGGRVIVPPYDGPGFGGAVLADPQGATFSVSRQTAQPAG